MSGHRAERVILSLLVALFWLVGIFIMLAGLGITTMLAACVCEVIVSMRVDPLSTVERDCFPLLAGVIFGFAVVTGMMTLAFSREGWPSLCYLTRSAWCDGTPGGGS